MAKKFPPIDPAELAALQAKIRELKLFPVGDEFKQLLKEACTYARSQAFGWKIAKVDVEGGKTIIKLYGDHVRWVFDNNAKLTTVEQREYRLLNDPAANDFHKPSYKRFDLLIRGKLPGQQELWAFFRSALDSFLAKHGWIDFSNPHDMKAAVLAQHKTLPEGVPWQDIFTQHERQKSQIGKSAVMVLNTAWGKGVNWKKSTGLIIKTLWATLDPEIARLAIMVGGQKADSYHYTLVWRNLEEVRKVAQHSPGLLAIWPHAVLSGQCERGMKGGPHDYPNIVSDCKAYLERQGALSKKAWKLLLKMKPMWVHYMMTKVNENRTKYGTQAMDPWAIQRNGAALIQPADAKLLSSFGDYMDFFADVGTTPKFTIFLYSFRVLGNLPITPTKIAFFRAAFEASRKSRAVKRFWLMEVQQAFDWLERGGVQQGTPIVFDHNQMKADWKWIMRTQRLWHRTNAIVTKASNPDAKWESLIEEFTFNGFKAVPLNTAIDLVEEGLAMHHCVGGYELGCMRGDRRIFSIRKGRKRISTCEITSRVTTNDEGQNVVRWSVNQNLGPCNEDPGSGATSIGNLIKTRYQKAWDAIPEEEKAKQFPGVAPKDLMRMDDEQPRRAVEPLGVQIDWENIRQPVPAGARIGDMDW